MLFTLKIVWKLVKLFVRAVRKLVGLALFPVTFLLGRLGGGDDDPTARTDATGRSADDAPDRREERAAAAGPSEASGTDAPDATASSAAGATTGTATDDAGDPVGRPAGEEDPTAAVGATAGAAAASPGVDAEAADAYRTFRRALYLYAGWVVADFVLWFAVISGRFGVQFGDLRPGILLLSVGLGAAIPAGLGVLARRRTKAVWGVAFGLAAVTLATSTLGLLGVHLFGPFGNNVELMTDLTETPLLGVSRLVGLGLLARVTYYGWQGRAVVGVGEGADAARSRAGTPGTANAVGAAAGGAQAMSGAANAAESSPTDDAGDTGDDAPPTAGDGVADEPPTPASATDPSGPAPDAPADGEASPTAADATAESTAGAQSGDAPGTQSVAAADDAPPDADSDAPSTGDDAAESDAEESADDAGAAGESADSVATALADVDHADPDPDAVRALGDAVATAGLTDEAAAALSSLATADDEVVRMAVCAVCRQLSDDRADEVLRRLRIDTSDEVSAAAIEALRRR